MHIMIKLLLVIPLLIKEAQTILGLRNHRDYLGHYFPECVLSSISSLGDKGMYWGIRFLCSKIFWKHKVK